MDGKWGYFISPRCRKINKSCENVRGPAKVGITGPLSSSQELLLQGQQPVPQPLHSYTLAPQPPQLAQQPPTQPPHMSSWADEVATEQSGHSTPETLVPIGPIPVRFPPPPRSQPLTYPPPLIPKPASQPTTIQRPRHGPTTVPPPRHQPPFPQHLPHDRPTSTDNYTCTDRTLHQEDSPGLWHMRSILSAHRQFRPHSRLLGLQPINHKAQSPLAQKQV